MNTAQKLGQYRQELISQGFSPEAAEALVRDVAPTDIADVHVEQAPQAQGESTSEFAARFDGMSPEEMQRALQDAEKAKRKA